MRGNRDRNFVLVTIECSYCAKQDKVLMTNTSGYAKRGKLIGHVCQSCHRDRNHYVSRIEDFEPEENEEDKPEVVIFS
jgi:hypothetical protein